MILFCNKHGMSKFTIRKDKKKVCSLCQMVSAKSYRMRLKEKAVEYKGGCCEICGYNKCTRSLVFHHKDPSQKDFAIGESRQGKKIVRQWDLVKIELDKCQLLCGNCHNELHYEIDKSKDDLNFTYGIQRKNVNLINTHILKGRFTSEQMMEKINSGEYNTPEKLNHRELIHKKWIEKTINQT